MNAKLPNVVDTGVEADAALAEKSVRQLADNLAVRNGVSVGLSACTNNRIRRSSIEIEASFLRAGASSNFANNQDIQLTTLMPRFTFSPISNVKYDFVEIGFGVGVYWFSSRGFDGFSGIIVQPIYFDFHAPTILGKYRSGDHKWWWLGRLAAMPDYRWGRVVSPSGFAADAFGGVGTHNVRIPSEFVRSRTFGLNVEPLLSLLRLRHE
jgi:hypothetical protein